MTNAAQSRPTMKKRVEYVAFWHGIPPEEIYRPESRAGSRRPHILTARHDAIAEVATARPDWSYPRLGRFFGIDHTTVLNALRKRGVWKPRKPGHPGVKNQRHAAAAE